MSRQKIVAQVIGATALSFSAIVVHSGGLLDLAFEDANFSIFESDGGRINNPYWPLRPIPGESLTFSYVSSGSEECVIDQLTVTGLADALDGAPPYSGFVPVEVIDIEYVIEGVEDCRLELLADLDEGQLNEAVTEATRDWYAQDNEQNIWYLGEISRVYGEGDCEPYDGVPPSRDDFDPDDECFEGSWEAGKNSAPTDEDPIVGEAGIVVPSDTPSVRAALGTGTYYMQEIAYEAEDMAKVLRVKARLIMDVGEFAGDMYTRCRKVKEWTLLDPGKSVEHKWYCPDPGPGLVLIEGIGGGVTEVESLVSVVSQEL